MNLMLCLLIKATSKRIARYMDEYLPMISIRATDLAKEFKLLCDITAASTSTPHSSSTAIGNQDDNRYSGAAVSTNTTHEKISNLEMSTKGDEAETLI